MRIRHVVLLAIAALLLVPSMAAAKPGERTFEQTYPYASKLCKKADEGKLGPKLTASKDKVLAACATLKESFTTAQTTYASTTAPLKAKAEAIAASVKAACVKDSDPAACEAARTQAHVDLKALHETAKGAQKTYIASVKSGRKAFWGTIKTLRGGKDVVSDPTTTTPTLPPAPVLPS